MAAESAPSWWKRGAHDEALVRGVLTYGFGHWKGIFDDRSLFPPSAVVDKELKTYALKRLRSITELLKAANPQAKPPPPAQKGEKRPLPRAMMAPAPAPAKKEPAANTAAPDAAVTNSKKEGGAKAPVAPGAKAEPSAAAASSSAPKPGVKTEGAKTEGVKTVSLGDFKVRHLPRSHPFHALPFPSHAFLVPISRLLSHTALTPSMPSHATSPHLSPSMPFSRHLPTPLAFHALFTSSPHPSRLPCPFHATSHTRCSPCRPVALRAPCRSQMTTTRRRSSRSSWKASEGCRSSWKASEGCRSSWKAAEGSRSSWKLVRGS